MNLGIEFRRVPSSCVGGKRWIFLRLGRESGWTLDIVANCHPPGKAFRQRLSTSNMKLCKFGEDKLNRSCSCKLLESLWMNVDNYWYLLPSELKKPEVADNLANQCCPNHTILEVVS